MKNLFFKVISIIVVVLFVSCSTDEIVEEETVEPVIVSGSFEFSEFGDQEFEIDAQSIRATITIVGAGGGGAGGSLYHLGQRHSTAGGGGGGAGEVVELIDVSLDSNIIYSVTVGAAGSGGNINSNGSDGLPTTISIDGQVIFSANQGLGGISNGDGSRIGGTGGSGLPSGNTGGSGNSLDFFNSGNGGIGGNGGDNLNDFGLGGRGGNGSDVDFGSEENTQPGDNGVDGYILIEWVGLK